MEEPRAPVVPRWQRQEWRRQGSVLSTAVERGEKAAHGRKELREAWALADAELNAYVGSSGTVGKPWPHVAQIICFRRVRQVKGVWKEEISYAITSLPPKRAGAAELLWMGRKYWRIETQLHWVRDVTLGEDQSQVRTEAAPQVCAALRNLVVTLLRRLGSENIAASLRTLGSRPREALTLFFALTRP